MLRIAISAALKPKSPQKVIWLTTTAVAWNSEPQPSATAPGRCSATLKQRRSRHETAITWTTVNACMKYANRASAATAVHHFRRLLSFEMEKHHTWLVISWWAAGRGRVKQCVRNEGRCARAGGRTWLLHRHRPPPGAPPPAQSASPSEDDSAIPTLTGGGPDSISEFIYFGVQLHGPRLLLQMAHDGAERIIAPEHAVSNVAFQRRVAVGRP